MLACGGLRRARHTESRRFPNAGIFVFRVHEGHKQIAEIGAFGQSGTFVAFGFRAFGESGAAAERTVVRPTYSYMGEYFVDERVLEDIVTCVAWQMPGVSSVIRVVQDPRPETFKLSVAVKVKHGFSVWAIARQLQDEINDKVEQMTAFNVTEVNVEVRALEE